MTNNDQTIVEQGGAIHGKFIDATPFGSSPAHASEGQKSESSSLVDELGEMLRAEGFNYHGNEVLYSGVYGTELTCEIFIGPVYYQRLRHMVSDKFQVGSPYNNCSRHTIRGVSICLFSDLYCDGVSFIYYFICRYL